MTFCTTSSAAEGVCVDARLKKIVHLKILGSFRCSHVFFENVCSGKRSTAETASASAMRIIGPSCGQTPSLCYLCFAHRKVYNVTNYT